MRKQQAYYCVFAVKDGTIWHASPKRKPARSLGRKPRIDEDGIFWWIVDEKDEADQYPQLAKISRGATIATCLNVKRLLRESVATRLDRLERQLAALQEQLTRVEQMLARGTSDQERDGR